MPQLPLPLLLGGAVALVIILALLLRLLGGPGRLPYQRREDFLSAAELAFFRVLEKAVDGERYIFPKVRIGDLLNVVEGAENARGWFARIGQKHVDFVLADREGVRPMLVIELDDSSHERADRRERDEFVDSAMEAAGLPILRVPVRQEYSAGELAEAISSRI